VEMDGTHCSSAIFFMPSRSAGVTRLLRYCLAGAPCRAASDGMAAAGSGWAEAAREPPLPGAFAPASPARLCSGVAVRAGAGDGALLNVGGTVELAGAGAAPVVAGVAEEDSCATSLSANCVTSTSARGNGQVA
jgi:hypothetical protein